MKFTMIRPALLLFLSLGLFAGTAGAGPVDDHPMIGETAPEFHLPTTDGDSLTMESLRGKYVVLHFGASW